MHRFWWFDHFVSFSSELCHQQRLLYNCQLSRNHVHTSHHWVTLQWSHWCQSSHELSLLSQACHCNNLLLATVSSSLSCSSNSGSDHPTTHVTNSDSDSGLQWCSTNSVLVQQPCLAVLYQPPPLVTLCNSGVANYHTFTLSESRESSRWYVDSSWTHF